MNQAAETASVVDPNLAAHQSGQEGPQDDINQANYGYGYQDPTTLATGLALCQLVPEISDGSLGEEAIAVARSMTGFGARCEIVGHPGKGNSGSDVVTYLRGLGIHYEPLALHRKGLRSLLRNRRLLLRHGRLFRPNLIHAHSRAPAWVGLRVAEKLGVPLVTTFHGLYNYRSGIKRKYNAVMARGTRVIAPSHFVRGHIEGHYPEAEGRIRVIPRGLDLVAYNRARFHQGDIQAVHDRFGLVPGRPILVTSGRLSFWKGQHLFIDLIKQLSDLNPYGLIFARNEGKKDYRSSLKDSIARHGLKDSVQIITEPLDMRPIYLAADAVVSTSVEPEAFLHPITEAMLLGQPVIAPDHGAAPEQIVHHETGWLYKPNNLDALSQCVREALSLNDEARANLGQWAMDDARAAYDQKSVMLSTLDVYREALNEAGMMR